MAFAHPGEDAAGVALGEQAGGRWRPALSERFYWNDRQAPDQCAQLGLAAHVWLTRIPSCGIGHRRPRYESLLSADECKRYQRFFFEPDRLTFLVAHALVRTALSSYSPTLPAQWSFRFNRYGRPEIDAAGGSSSLRFNLTHSGDLVACVVSKTIACGIDVESMRPVENLMRLARAVLAPQELEELRSRPPGERLAHFYEYWTLKESYIKARGLGLSLPLRALDFRFEGAHLAGFETTAAVGDDRSYWQFSVGQVDASHKLAVALRRANATRLAVLCRFVEP